MTETFAQKLEQAISYFSNLEITIEKPVKVFAPDEFDTYRNHLIAAQLVVIELEKYDQKGLEYLALQGFSIPMAVQIGQSQQAVNSIVSSLHEGCKINSDGLQQILRVLEVYEEIRPSEEIVTDFDKFRKIKAIEEAMRISLS